MSEIATIRPRRSAEAFRAALLAKAAVSVPPPVAPVAAGGEGLTRGGFATGFARAYPLELQALLNPFCDWLRNEGLAPKSVHQYRHKMGAFLEWQAGRPLTQQLIREWRTHLQKDHAVAGQAHTGLRPRTIGVHLVALYKYCDYLAEQGHTDLPVRNGVKRPKADKPGRAVPTEAEVAALFAATAKLNPRGTPYATFRAAQAGAVLALAAQCGLRRQEILDLDVSDIRDTPKGPEVVVRSGKGGKMRRIPLTGEALQYLAVYLEKRTIRAESCHWPPEQRALFAVDTTRRLCERGIVKVLREVKELAGLGATAYGLHGLRHVCATYLMKEGVDLKTIQAIMGHERIETLLEHYLHEGTEDEMRAGLDALSTRLFTANNPAPVIAPKPERVPSLAEAGERAARPAPRPSRLRTDRRADRRGRRAS